ncbi:hypothetical protein CHELA1G11_12772 [Hyphomicrobiales bacterium]|nr:hypothetical protein CHELA1G2_11536 [Hyphomicrobiales bacterium]CAH1667018.1 hypothetical protein CHELA1G11_12772 [Hyphomicrobiales bacterium]
MDINHFIPHSYLDNPGRCTALSSGSRDHGPRNSRDVTARRSARTLRSTIGSMFRYAVATARADTDPTFALRGALTARQTKSWAALTEPRAFRASCGRSIASRGRPRRQPR